MEGVKKLMPILREKKRYLAFEIISKSKMELYSRIFEAIKANFAHFYGTEGLGKAGIMPIAGCWNKEKQAGVIRVNNKYLNRLRGSLVMIDRIEGNEVIVRSIGVSGILKKAKSWVI